MSIAHKRIHGQNLSNIGSGPGRSESGSRKGSGRRQPIGCELRRKAFGGTPAKTGIPQKVTRSEAIRRLVEPGLKAKK
jgi:hypothetical protein